MNTISVVDPNRLCSDPDPASHVHSDPDPAPGSEQDPNKFGSGSNLNMSNFLKIKDLTVVKMIILVLKFSSQVILKSMYIHLETKFKFLSIKNHVLLNKICIRILSAPDPDPNQLF
jgi:hypothetical protein